MSFADAVSSGFRKYIRFSGRARRSEYWYWFLFTLITMLGCAALDGATGLLGQSGFLALAYLVLLVPSLAASVRRLHDTGHSAWWLLLALVPLAALVLLVWYLSDSEPGPVNRYGPNPKLAAGMYSATGTRSA